MSEHQIYEFRCVDRQLGARERGELRKISSRAQITSTRFHNEYAWGDLKANPIDMLATYFDVFFYMANWGTRRLAIKLPRTALSKATIDAYTCDSVEYHRRSDDVIVDIMSPEDDYLEEYWTYEDALDDLVGLREQLLAGDHRALFMIWLDEAIRSPRSRAARRTAPTIPDGLSTLSPSLDMLAKIFTLDRDLIDAAASANPTRSRARSKGSPRSAKTSS